MNNKLKRMWKEAIVAQFKALTQHLLVDTEESHEKHSVRIAGLLAEI
jgi:hypothetical protein